MATQSLKFLVTAKHGKMTFLPGPAYGFEDPDAVPYFTRMGWAEESDEDPVIVFSQEEINIDPETTFADGPNKGQKVLGD